MKNRRWVVRVVTQSVEHWFDNPFLECLRYARVVVVHNDHCFDLEAPVGVFDTKQWAEMNAERMSTFGLNAVAAPEWRAGDPGPSPKEGESS